MFTVDFLFYTQKKYLIRSNRFPNRYKNNAHTVSFYITYEIIQIAILLFKKSLISSTKLTVKVQQFITSSKYIWTWLYFSCMSIEYIKLVYLCTDFVSSRKSHLFSTFHFNVCKQNERYCSSSASSVDLTELSMENSEHSFDQIN